MKTATSGFISAISDGCPYHTVKFYYNGTELDITPKTFNYYGLMIGGENINIGETCASHVEFEIYNPTVTLENKEIQVKVGIEVNGSIEYVSLGYFTVTKPSIESEVYKYIAYDRMIGLERLYVSSLTNPTTSTVMNEIATQLGYSFASTITEISLDVNKVKGYTYREMLGFISALCGANCIFNGDGAIEFKWFVQPTSNLASIGTDRLYENGLELNSDNDLTVGYIKCATGETNENTTTDENGEENTETTDVILSVGSGSFGINISNPLMTQTVLENIYNTYFSNFTFRPCKVNMLGNILLECGDIVTVNNGVNTYNVPIMSIQHSIDGGVVTNIETIAQNETEQEISYTSPTVKLMDRVYYEILEANKAIINDLTANTVTTEYLKANYAQINLANIENGCITNAMIGTEAVKTSQIADGSITDAKIVELTANKIKAGTLDVERLIVTQNNQKYLFHINEDGTTEYQKLNGNILEDRSITADKIVANAITANEIATATITANEIAANTITSAEIKSGSIKAVDIDVANLFAQDITATGTISGLTLKGAELDINDGIYFVDADHKTIGTISSHIVSINSKSVKTLDFKSQSIYLEGGTSSQIALDEENFLLSYGTTVIKLETNQVTISNSLYVNNKIYENGTALSSKYAPYSHSHSGYASSSHTHSNYVRTDANTTITSAQVTLGSGTSSYTNRKYYINNVGNGSFATAWIDSLSYYSGGNKSSKRFKYDIEYRENDYWHDNLLKVKPCTYKYNNHNEIRYGFIAEDILELYPEIIMFDEDGKCDAIQYDLFIPILVSEVQRLNKEIDRLENLIKGVQK